jgi:hypothetical protein
MAVESSTTSHPIDNVIYGRESEEVDALFCALAEARLEFPEILQDKKNPFFHSKYASLGSIIKKTLIPLNNNSLVVLQRVVCDSLGRSFVLTRLFHKRSSQFIEEAAPVNLSIKYEEPDSRDLRKGVLIRKTTDITTAQAYGSFVTYLKRYAYITMLGIVADEEVEDDGELTMFRASSPKKTRVPKALCSKISDLQKEVLKKALDGNREIEEKLLKGLKIREISDLKSSSYEGCLKRIIQLDKKENP